MNVLVSGSHGLIGSALVLALQLGGHNVRRLARGTAGNGDVSYDVAVGRIDTAAMTGVDAVVHLAGEGIGERRWSAAQKARIRDSRIVGTTLLAEAAVGMAKPPKVFVSGSAIGIYGDRGDEVLTEDSTLGDDFLALMCRDWEAATAPAKAAGIRVVHLRSGIVLSGRGGAIKKQLPLFRLGLGGRLASGKQWTSWVSLHDEVGAILHVLRSDDVSGPINVTAPNPVTNAELTSAFGRAVRRPARLPVPKIALDVVLSPGLASAITSSQRALPARLEAHGYHFKHPEVTSALDAALRDT
ncbi:MAG: TIGR01777 family oxidoreductase [Actinobacteria bacterium]|nr:TIGR01777 family oxidoreductase [Actinomycetota bacterium]